MKTNYEKRIEYLENRYKETTISKGEIISPERRKQINRMNYESFRRDRVYQTLNHCDLPKTVIRDTLYIIEHNNMKDLCRNCSDSQIISVIALHLLRKYQKIDEEKHFLWKQYDLNWRMYARIISNLYLHH